MGGQRLRDRGEQEAPQIQEGTVGEVGRKPGDLDAPGKVVLEVEGRSLPWWIRLRLQRVGSVLSCSATLSTLLATGKGWAVRGER